MYIYELVLETTRKCNLRCAHCMRGNPQRMTMTPQILQAVLSSCTGIGTVTFGGGEPSLAPEVFEEFFNISHWRHINFESFYIVTNGKAHNGLSRFMRAVDRLYWMAGEQDACSLVVSQDQYHKALREVNWGRYEMKDETGRSYDEFPPYFDMKSRTGDIHNPIAEGRAIETQVGWREPEQQKPFEVEEYNGEVHVRSDDAKYVYVAANGNVVSGCNMSFRRIDKESKGNVLQKPLSEIIEGYCVRKDEEVEEEKQAVSV